MRAIDANQRVAGDQAVLFSETSARASAVWLTAVEGGILLRGDAGGDGVHDFEIMMTGLARIAGGDLLL